MFAERRVFDAEDPDDGRQLQRSGAASPRRCSARSARPARYTPPRSRRRASRAAASGPRPPTPTRPRSSRSRSIPTTGWIHVPRVWIAHDIGRALNPTLVRGQVEGSVYMALGEALMEEQAFRRLPPQLSHALVHKFPSMLEYKSPTTLDMPRGDHRADRGPGSARPVRRQGSRPGAAAAGDAGGRQRVYDAVGVRIDEVPIPPDKILKALEAKAQGRGAALRPARPSPRSTSARRCIVPTPGEGGDGTRDQRLPRASCAPACARPPAR